jgi:hypothetical protein
MVSSFYRFLNDHVVATSFFGRKQSSPVPTQTVPDTQAGLGESGTPLASDSPNQAVLGWPLGSPLSMHVYLSTLPEDKIFAQGALRDDLPSFVWNDITFGDWNEARMADVEVKIPKVSSRFSSCIHDCYSDIGNRVCKIMARYGLMYS